MNSRTSSPTGSVIYLSHGGGPLPLLGGTGHQGMLDFIKAALPQLIEPTAIVVISAHWECPVPTITSTAVPALIYDYYGFPEAAYQIQYPASGSPALADKIFQRLENAGITAKLNGQRGFDHGVFVPLKLMYPQANIPCVQLSLVNGLQPELHIRLGQALAGLKDELVLIIGSGLSFHNINAFFTASTPATKAMNASFEQWLLETCSSTQLTENERTQRLLNWHKAPAADYCHPRAEHLLPIHVCYGAAGTAAKQAFAFEILGKKTSAYVW